MATMASKSALDDFAKSADLDFALVVMFNTQPSDAVLTILNKLLPQPTAASAASSSPQSSSSTSSQRNVKARHVHPLHALRALLRTHISTLSISQTVLDDICSEQRIKKLPRFVLSPDSSKFRMHVQFSTLEACTAFTDIIPANHPIISYVKSPCVQTGLADRPRP